MTLEGYKPYEKWINCGIHKHILVDKWEWILGGAAFVGTCQACRIHNETAPFGGQPYHHQYSVYLS